MQYWAFVIKEGYFIDLYCSKTFNLYQNCLTSDEHAYML